MEKELMEMDEEVVERFRETVENAIYLATQLSDEAEFEGELFNYITNIQDKLEEVHYSKIIDR